MMNSIQSGDWQRVARGLHCFLADLVLSQPSAPARRQMRLLQGLRPWCMGAASSIFPVIIYLYPTKSLIF
jgi:hypothetical protein